MICTVRGSATGICCSSATAPGPAAAIWCWRGEGIAQVHVRALQLRPQGLQPDLFCPRDEKRERLYQAIDAVNQRFGEFAIMPAALIKRTQQPDVIAPAWKPDGHRQTLHRPARAIHHSAVRIHRL